MSPAEAVRLPGDDPRWLAGGDWAVRVQEPRPEAARRPVALEWAHEEHLGWLFPGEARELAAAAEYADGEAGEGDE